ncbi:MAG: hypothetical protein A2583_10285 [Bdellovibrionales bacterium RIFOXYD1_FULL_53_11]|nr:MAG: hypothetical protein A2583_10285 [Bdellovibrionales bacterium RIFOXYD1_FULL_53_11]
MQEPDLFLIFLSRLNKIHIKYAVTGSVAMIAYGEPRMTHDLDLIVALSIADIEKVIAEFDENSFYCPPKESIMIEARRNIRGHFNIIHHETGFKADFFLVGADNLADWAMKNIVKLEYFEQTIRLAPIEYVIVKKLAFYKEGNQQKHLDDIRSILQHSKGKIDMALLAGFIDEYSLNKEWGLATA